jgi:hypothetical protein
VVAARRVSCAWRKMQPIYFNPACWVICILHQYDWIYLNNRKHYHPLTQMYRSIRAELCFDPFSSANHIPVLHYPLAWGDDSDTDEYNNANIEDSIAREYDGLAENHDNLANDYAGLATAHNNLATDHADLAMCRDNRAKGHTDMAKYHDNIAKDYAARMKEHDNLAKDYATRAVNYCAHQAEDHVEADRVEADRVEADRVEKDHVEEDRVDDDRVEEDRVDDDRAEEDRVEDDRVDDHDEFLGPIVQRLPPHLLPPIAAMWSDPAIYNLICKFCKNMQNITYNVNGNITGIICASCCIIVGHHESNHCTGDYGNCGKIRFVDPLGNVARLCRGCHVFESYLKRRKKPRNRHGRRIISGR